MKHTAATKRKLSLMRSGENNPFFGQRHTEETKRKLAAITRDYNLNDRTYKINQRTMAIPTGQELSYIAAMVDGEGSIGFRRNRYPFVAIYNSDLALWKWLTTQTSVAPKWTDARGRVPGWTWSVVSVGNVYWLCKALLPWLVIKKKKAEDVIAFLDRKYGTQKLREVS